MDEKNELKEQKQDKKSTKDKNHKPLLQSFNEWFSNLRGEFRKIIWPSRKDLVKQTTTVIITSLVVGLVVVAMNFVFFNALTILAGFLPM